MNNEKPAEEREKESGRIIKPQEPRYTNEKEPLYIMKYEIDRCLPQYPQNYSINN